MNITILLDHPIDNYAMSCILLAMPLYPVFSDMKSVDIPGVEISHQGITSKKTL